jgi:predicted phosphate transport protein (TIGR00153 family)
VFRKKKDFFALMVQAAENIEVAAKAFHEGLKDIRNPETFAASLKEIEQRGDRYTQEIIRLLNATYMTPIEREDIFDIAVTIDDVLDAIEACASRFDLFDIRDIPAPVHSFAVNIVHCTSEMTHALRKLRKRDFGAIEPHVMRITELEKEGDGIYRAAIKSLFAGNPDPIHVIQYKEIYEILESVSDKCEDVADLLESVVMTNS